MRFAKLIGMLPVAGMLALGAVSAWAQASGEPIKIGAVVSATGAGAGLGVPERNGILLAPLTASLVADLILEGRDDPALALMAPNRAR